jgi:hypothetical protein
VLPFAWKWIILHTQHCVCIPSQLSHLMMLHVQGVRVPFSPVPHHAFNLLVLSVPSMSLGWLLLFNIKHGGLNFTLLTIFPHSQQLLACAIIVCLLAPCCLYFPKNWHAADSLSTWNQYKWMTMHHTSLNLLFPLSTPCF